MCAKCCCCHRVRWYRIRRWGRSIDSSHRFCIKRGRWFGTGNVGQRPPSIYHSLAECLEAIRVDAAKYGYKNVRISIKAHDKASSFGLKGLDGPDDY